MICVCRPDKLFCRMKLKETCSCVIGMIVGFPTLSRIEPRAYNAPSRDWACSAPMPSWAQPGATQSTHMIIIYFFSAPRFTELGNLNANHVSSFELIKRLLQWTYPVSYLLCCFPNVPLIFLIWDALQVKFWLKNNETCNIKVKWTL